MDSFKTTRRKEKAPFSEESQRAEWSWHGNPTQTNPDSLVSLRLWCLCHKMKLQYAESGDETLHTPQVFIPKGIKMNLQFSDWWAGGGGERLLGQLPGWDHQEGTAEKSTKKQIISPRKCPKKSLQLKFHFDNSPKKSPGNQRTTCRLRQHSGVCVWATAVLPLNPGGARCRNSTNWSKAPSPPSCQGQTLTQSD